MTAHTEVAAWFTGRLPEGWTAADDAQITVDREEIIVILSIEAPKLDDADAAADRQAAAGRIAGFRADTRDRRIAIARDAEHRFGAKVAWGVRIDDHEELFTHLAVPVMTRLRQPQRQVLDTLIAAGVARSRADAVAWCVRLVEQHTDDWLENLRDAIDDVERVRSEGPDA